MSQIRCSKGSGSCRVNCQGKGLDCRENGTGIVDILQVHRLDKSVYIVLWREVGHIGVAQDGWPRVGRDLVSERNTRQEIGNRHMNVDDHILNGWEGLPSDDSCDAARRWITIRVFANRDGSDNIANAVRDMFLNQKRYEGNNAAQELRELVGVQQDHEIAMKIREIGICSDHHLSRLCEAAAVKQPPSCRTRHS